MISFISYAPLALVAVSAVSGALVPTPNRLMKHALIARKVKPASYAEGYLEPYPTYHTRYLALGCENHHGQKFFDDCCHPMLATEKLETARPKKCHPSAAALSSAALAEPTSTVKTPDDDCDEEGPKPKATSGPPKHSHKGNGHKDAPEPKEAHKNQDPPQRNAASSSGGGFNTGGFGTFFTQNGVAGACGTVHSDNDLIAALDSAMYGDLNQQSPHCGKSMLVRNTKNGNTVNVIVADACPTCNNRNSVDLSVKAFEALATKAEGLIPIEWKFT